MAIMMITRLSIILYITCNVCIHKCFHLTGATTDYFYPLCFENILGALPHISGKHYGYSHLTQYWSDSTLASTSFR